MVLPSSMLEAQVHEDTSVTIHRVSLPQLTKPHDVLINVVACASNPKDWKMPAGLLHTIKGCPNSGDDMAGIVAAIGDEVVDFQVGDRVAALHQLGAPAGAYAEYALASDHMTFPLSKNFSFEDACTVPMGSMMSALGLYGMLRVRAGPWDQRPEEETPVLVYGAASNVGAFAVKWLTMTDVHPIICVAGQGHAFVESLIDKSRGDTIVDYRNGDEQLVGDIKAALNGKKLKHAFDCVSGGRSHLNIVEVLDILDASGEPARISLVLPRRMDDIPSSIEQSNTMIGSVWETLPLADKLGRMGLETGAHDWGYVFSRLVGKTLADGRLRPHPYVVVEGGLSGIEQGLKKLRSGKASATKYVYRIADTPGLQG